MRADDTANDTTDSTVGVGPNRAVTVVVPVRDGAAFIAACLRSLLAQHGGAPVVVVVDDGSTDGTAEVVRAEAEGVEVLRLPPNGVSAARNAGVRAATTPFVAFCDADDRWPPHRLTDDLQVFAGDPAVDAVLGHARLCPDEPSLLGSHRAAPGDVALLHSFCALTVRRRAFERVGPLDESLHQYEDYDWFLRMREVGLRLVVRSGVAFDRRMRAGSVSQPARQGVVDDATPAALLATLKRSLDRRRAGGSVGRRLPQLSELRWSGATVETAAAADAAEGES